MTHLSGYSDAATGGDAEGQAWYSVSQKNGYVVVSAAGEIDLATSPALHEAVSVAAKCSPRIAIDLTQATLLDATGLSALVGGLHRVRGQDGEVALVGTTGVVRSAVEGTGLHHVFAMHDHLEDGVAALMKSSTREP